MKKLATVILSAGQGKRMKSDLPKVLHPLLGRPMVHYVIDVAEQVGSVRTVLIVGHKKERVIEATRQRDVEYVEQREQLGTGHAVLQAAPLFKDFPGDILVLSGDVPLLRARTLQQLIDVHRRDEAVATMLTAHMEDPTGYGRVVRDAQGFVQEIVEEKDATDAIRQIKEINVGIYVFQAQPLFEALPRVDNNNAQGEYYLPDVLKIFVQEGRRIAAVPSPDPEETHGINTVEQLKQAEQILARRLKRA